MMSFDVNTVSTETITNRQTNSFFWLALAFDNVTHAMYLKNPTSSKNTESTDIEKKSTSIFMGFTAVSALKPAYTSFTEIHPDKMRAAAPAKTTIQYMLTLCFLTFTDGLNNMDVSIPAQVNSDIPTAVSTFSSKQSILRITRKLTYIIQPVIYRQPKFLMLQVPFITSYHYYKFLFSRV